MSRSTQVYVGELTRSVNPDALRSEFRSFGRIKNFSFKGRYAFIDYEDPKDAEKAVDRMHNERIEDCRLVVEFASKSLICDINLTKKLSEKPPRSGERSRREHGGRGPSPGDKCFNCNKTGHW